MDYITGSEPISKVSDSEIGILVIHGITSTPSSLSSLTNFFIKKNYNIECPRLSGHGTNWQDLEKTKYIEWINDVEKYYLELKKRSKKIFIAGLSMGGALASILSQNHPEISGLILINNALIMKDLRLKIISFLKYFKKTDKAIGCDIKDPDEKEICYDTIPLKSVHELMKLLKLAKKNINKINQPVLIFKSKEDHVVPIKSALYTFKNISSQNKELVWLENSYHVATMDYDKELICQKSFEFIEKII